MIFEILYSLIGQNWLFAVNLGARLTSWNGFSYCLKTIGLIFPRKLAEKSSQDLTFNSTIFTVSSLHIYDEGLLPVVDWIYMSYPAISFEKSFMVSCPVFSSRVMNDGTAMSYPDSASKIRLIRYF